jgi:hypothetical protein
VELTHRLGAHGRVSPVPGPGQVVLIQPGQEQVRGAVRRGALRLDHCEILAANVVADDLLDLRPRHLPERSAGDAFIERSPLPFQCPDGREQEQRDRDHNQITRIRKLPGNLADWRRE